MPITITGATLSGVTFNPTAVSTDPYFMYVPLLLNTTSTNAQQNNTFLDSSTNNFTITRNGTPTQGAFTPYQPSGYWSGYFNGSGDYITAPNTCATLGAPSGNTNDFTIEIFLYPTGTGIYSVIQTTYSTNNFWGIGINRNGSTGTNAIGRVAFYLTDSFSLETADNKVIANQWNHIAAVRTGTTVSLYVNGVREATNTSSINPAPTGVLQIGKDTVLNRDYLGYVSSARIVRGATQPYSASSSSITVPTTPLTAITNTSLLTLQSNRFIDNSSNAFAITVNGTPKVQAFQPFAPAASYSPATYGGSGYFSTSNYLTAPASTSWQFTGDYTLEAWIYLVSLADGTIYGTGGAGASDQFTYTSTGQLYWANQGTSAGVITTNQWLHVAAARSGTTLKIFVNGDTKLTATVSGTTGQNLTAYIARRSDGNNPVNGYISNLRIVNGTAVYTANFTPPTAPVTAITNTSLLLNYTNAGIYDAAWQNNALTVGDAQASTTQKQWGTTSMKFDGTGDYLTVPNTQSFAFGSGNWTIEAWVYLTANPSGSSAAYLTDFRGSNASNYTFGFIGSGGVTKMYAYSSPNGDVTGSQTVSLNAWNYVAYVRNGSTITIYLNGTSNGTLTTTYTQSASTVNIGSNSSGTETVTGYIQDLRITKGVARTITTPTAAFPTQ